MPPEYQLGHEEGDDPALVVHPILVRADSARASHRIVESLAGANFEYSIWFAISGSVRDALLLAQEEDWVRATDLGGGFSVASLSPEVGRMIEAKSSRIRKWCRSSQATRDS